MKPKTLKKSADEDRSKSRKDKKTRSSRSSRRRRHSSVSSYSSDSRSVSDSDSPPRKRPKKLPLPARRPKKLHSKKEKSRRRRRRRSPSSASESYSSRSSSSSSDRSRSLSPPRRSRSRDARKERERGRRREREREREGSKKRVEQRSRCYYSGGSDGSDGRSGRSRSRSYKEERERARSAMDDKIIQAYDDFPPPQNNKNATDGRTAKDDAVEYDKDDSPPAKNGNGGVVGVVNEKGEVLAGQGSPEAEDLELILRQKALENLRKFRAAAVSVVNKSDDDHREELVPDKPQDDDSRSPLQRQVSSPGVGPSTGLPRLLDTRNASSRLQRHGSSPRLIGSPRLLETRNTSSLLQTQGSSPIVSRATAAPRVRSVVSIPTRTEHDDRTIISPPGATENSAVGFNGGEVQQASNDFSKFEGTDEDSIKATEGLVSGASVLVSTCKNKTVVEDKAGSQFEKKTFSRMQDGETVQVSYKVYIPKKSPALARRQLQR